MNDRLKITTDTGELVDAQVPAIISGSRSTDISAIKWSSKQGLYLQMNDNKK
jgi:hypothetical protein